MPLVYAVEADLTAWLAGVDTEDLEVPDGARADRLLAQASRLVRRATRHDVYPTTAAGLPQDTDLVETLRDATCAQATTWLQLGLDPSQGPAGAVDALSVAASGIGGGSVQYATSVTGDDVRRAAAVELADDARLILLDGGFLTGQPGTL